MNPNRSRFVVARTVSCTLVFLCALVSIATVFATDTDCDGTLQDTEGYYCAVLSASDLIPDISGTGTLIVGWTGDADDGYKSVAMGNSFVWYGTSYTTAYVSTNGYVTFGGDSSAPIVSNTIPDGPAPANAIYAYGDDLNPGAGGSVHTQTTTCTVDRDVDGTNDACFVTQWTNVPNFAGTATVTVQVALDFATDEALVEIEAESGAGGTLPATIGTEDASGVAGLSYKPGAAGSSAAAAAGDQFVFDVGDTVAPADAANVSASGQGTNVTLAWETPGDVDFAGILVLQSTTAAPTAVPNDGVSYSVGNTIGSDLVVCVTTTGDESCNHTSGSTGARNYYKLFTFDTVRNYSAGIDHSIYLQDTTQFKWNYGTGASSLAAVGIVPNQYVVASGNDQRLHRMAEANGARGNWNVPVFSGSVQARPMVGDLNPDGTADVTAFISTQGGFLYRVGLDDGVSAAEATRNVAATGGDAGCSGGLLQAGPVIMLDAYDSNANNNDNVVVVATRCSTTNNKVMLYSHDLVTLYDTYAGGAGGLGISNDTPAILYRNSGNNLVYVPVRAAGGESLLVLEVDSSPSFVDTPYAEVTGIGDIDASPAIVRRGSERLLVVGSTAGTVYLYDAEDRVGGAGSALQLISSKITSNGAVKGVAVSNPIEITPGLYENWVVWSTTSRVHGIKIGTNGAFDGTSYWNRALTSPSAPVVLLNVQTPGDALAYVGATGQLFELDVLAAGSAINRSWNIESGLATGAPTFDYRSGTSQGIVVGTTSGTLHWVRLN